jgi:hypothetical protein
MDLAITEQQQGFIYKICSDHGVKEDDPIFAMLKVQCLLDKARERPIDKGLLDTLRALVTAATTFEETISSQKIVAESMRRQLQWLRDFKMYLILGTACLAGLITGGGGFFVGRSLANPMIGSSVVKTSKNSIRLDIPLSSLISATKTEYGFSVILKRD